jgi:hypothetical protein
MAVAGLFVAVSLATVGTSTAVSTPTPHPPVTCPPTIDLASLREDTALALAGLTASTHADNPLPSSYESVQLRWTALPLPEGCIAVFRRGPGDADFPARPHTLLGPQQDQWYDWEIDRAGEHCYRLVAVGRETRGPSSEVCATPAWNRETVAEPRTVWQVGGVLLALGVAGGAGLVVLRRRRTS